MREAPLNRPDAQPGSPDAGMYESWAQRARVERRSIRVDVPAATVFAAIERIGGDTGWYAFDALWQIRGAVDRLMGGPGMSRGRRHPARLVPGDVIDCWRVEELVPGRRLSLAAEMRLPGRAWLELEVTPEGGAARLHQRVTFEPRGLLGLAYWYGVLPLHASVFGGMLRGIARAARQDRSRSESFLRVPRQGADVGVAPARRTTERTS